MSIYKYVISERLDILKNARIRFSQASALNDPIEMRPFFEQLFEDSFFREGSKKILSDEKKQATVMEEWFKSTGDSFRKTWDDMIREEYDKIREEFDNLPPPPPDVSFSFDEFKKLVEEEFVLHQGVEQALEFSKGDDVIARAREGLYQSLNESFGILSLTEKPDNLLMWAHYAGQHQGFVIEFDETHPYFNKKKGIKDEFKFNHLVKMKYSIDRPHKVSMMDIFDETMYLIKGKDWKYEQEWRILRELKDSDVKIPAPAGDIHLFSFPPECVKGIILGARMSDKDKTEIINLARNDPRYKHLKVYQASVDDRKFQLNIEPIQPAAKPNNSLEPTSR